MFFVFAVLLSFMSSSLYAMDDDSKCYKPFAVEHESILYVVAVPHSFGDIDASCVNVDSKWTPQGSVEVKVVVFSEDETVCIESNPECAFRLTTRADGAWMTATGLKSNAEVLKNQSVLTNMQILESCLRFLQRKNSKK